MSHRSVYCIAASHARTHLILHRLNAIEFPSSEISVLFLDTDTRATRDASSKKSPYKNIRGNKTPALAYPELGESSPSRTIILPGVGSLAAVGPVAVILDAAGIYGIAGGLREFDVPESEACRYEARTKQGHVFLGIRAENPDKRDLVRGIFTAEGAEDIRTLMHVLTPRTSRRSLYGPSVSVGR